jgi:hypothetical protein
MASFRLWKWALAALIVAGGSLVALNVQDISAQSGDPTLRVVAPTDSVKEGDKAIPFEVHADNVDNVASFQFVMQYRDDVFKFASAQQGPFLGSTQREVVCNDPISDAGSVRFTCITLRTEPVGASGSGLLATIFLDATGSGATDVSLDRVKLLRVDENASEIADVTVQAASVDVEGTGGTNWLMWGGIIAAAVIILGGVGALAAMRMRGGASNVRPKVELPQ